MITLFKSYVSQDKSSRLKKAGKIIKIISRYKNINKSKILDIGCGAGYLDSMLCQKSKLYIGIDFVDERKIRSFPFLRATTLKLPFKDNSFNIIICNHVIEHVHNPDKLLYEINRLLKRDGICYITSPNKLWPLEPHLKLPFLSFLPKRIADAYVKIACKGQVYDVYPMTYSKFTGKLKKLFDVENFTLEILKYPYEYEFDNRFYYVFSISRYLPLSILKIINHFLPNWILILRKKTIS